MDSRQERLTRPDGLATRLRVLRERAGLSGRDLVREHGWQPSKVSKIEHGDQLPSPADINAWVATVGADADTLDELLELRDDAQTEHRTFSRRMRRGQLPVQQGYNELVAQASTVRNVSTVYVPGLLQIPAYTRRVLDESRVLHGSAAADVEEAVSARMERQRFLYDNGKEFDFLLCEPVLRWLLVPPSVMRAQLDRIHAAIGLANVRIGVLPMGSELSATPQNSVDIFAIADEPVAMVETMVGESTHKGEQAAAYLLAVDRLWAEAAEGEAARPFIAAAIQALPA